MIGFLLGGRYRGKKKWRQSLHWFWSITVLVLSTFQVEVAIKTKSSYLKKKLSNSGRIVLGTYT